MGGINQTALFSAASFDPTAKQLERQAFGIGAGAAAFDPTTKAITSNHETDKQSEENATWLFEYRALLNSKLTTLTTSLTSAYTTDLDAAMGKNSSSVKPAYLTGQDLWGNKNAMQGLTGQKDAANATIIDPGAGRTVVVYASGFASNTGGLTFVSSAGWAKNDSTAVTEGTTFHLQYNSTVSGSFTGTTSFLSGGNGIELDRLTVNTVDLSKNQYENGKFLHMKLYEGELPAETTYRKIGNNLEKTLYNFFAKRENLDVIKFGLFNDVFVVGTSSLPTGSQVQGSVKLEWDQGGGFIGIKQERFAAFFHS